ncbi:hypothetical protein [Ekhidna sp.]|uniref:hypothetical protein n=1 Tax=Ekhidna sp. TaxID=2608089 RepID=UPI003B5C56A5
MDLEHLLYGLIAFLIGLIAKISDKPRSWKEKKTRPLGLSEARFKGGYWALMLAGIVMILISVF